MRKILLIAALLIFFDTTAQISSAQSGQWQETTTWVGGVVPDSNDDVIIAHDITVINAQTAQTVQVNYGDTNTLSISGTGASLTVSGNVDNSDEILITGGSVSNPATLTVNGTLTNNNGIININAGQRLIMGSGNDISTNSAINVNSSSDAHGSLYLSGDYQKTAAGGVVNYNRHISNLSTWDLISVPISDLDINDFATGETDLATGTGSDSGQYAIGTYSNTTASYPGNTWLNYTTSTAPTAGDFTPGKGYQMAAAGSASGTGVGAEMTFSGRPNTGTIEINVINSETGGTGDNDHSNGTKFNLVGNPYPSFISVASFISGNSGVLHSGIHQAVYGWNGSSYDTYNNSTGGFIAPGQGFMIGAQAASATPLRFTTSMQSTANTAADDFISGDIMDDDRAELFISLSQNNIDNRTRLYFLDNTTDGLDISYDAAVIGFDDNSIYSRLLQDDEGYAIDVQALAYSEMWDKVIPLGINAIGGEEMTISISHRTTPVDLNIYLEDTEESTMTNLLDGDYLLTPTSDLSGVGRFFIHMTADTMSNEEVSTSMLNAYKEIDASYITIEGLATQSNETKVSLYNILGREVLSTTLNNNMGTQTISTVGLSAGIYVIELESGSDRLTKKLLIQ